MSDKIMAKKAPLLSSKTVGKKQKNIPSLNANVNENAEKVAQSAPEKKEFSIRSGSSIKRLRITSSGEGANDEIRAPKRNDANSPYEGEPVLMLTPQNGMPMKRSWGYRAAHIFVSLATAIWFGLVFGYIHTQIGWGNFIAMEPPMLGGFVAGILAPAAFLWMMLAYTQRGADIQMYADNLRSELQSMLFPTEERAQVIHKDIEELCKQAAELSAASKSVLRSIHRARMGLRNEVNDYTGITKKAEFHMDRLSETLNQRGEKLLEITQGLEEKTTGMKAKGEESIQLWDKASEIISEKSEKMEKTLQSGAKNIIDAANDVDGKILSVKEKMTSSYKGLSEAVNEISGKIDNFEGMLDSMKNAGQNIQDNRDAMDVASQELSEQAAKIADALNAGIDKVEGAISRMGKDTEGFENVIDEKVDAINNSVHGLKSKIDNIGDIGSDTAKTIDQALSVAISGTQTVHSNIRNSVHAIYKASKVANDQADKLAEQADEQVKVLTQKSNDRAQEVAKTLELIEESTKRVETLSQSSDVKVETLVQSLDEQIEKMNTAKARLTDGLENVSTVFEKPLSDIRENVDRVSKTHEDIEERLQERIENLNQAAARNTNSAKTVSDDMRKHAQDIAAMTGQIAGHTKSVNEELDTQKSKIHSFINIAETDIQRLMSMADEKVNALKDVTTASSEGVSVATQKLGETHTAIVDQTMHSQEHLTALNLSLENIAERIQAASAQSKQAMDEARKEAHKSQESIGPIYDNVLAQANKAHSRLEILKTDLSQVSEANESAIQTASKTFEERLDALSVGSQDAANILNDTSDTMKARIEDIHSASTMAEESMRKIENTLEHQSTDMRLATDQAVIKIENVQKAVNKQFHDLTEQVAQAVVEIENTGEALTKQKEQVQETAKRAQSAIVGVGHTTKTEQERLNSAIQETANMTDTLVDHVKTESKALVNAAEESTKSLKQMGDHLALRTGEVNAHIEASMKTSQGYAKELEGQTEKIAKTSLAAADKISDAIGIVGKQMDKVSGDTKSLLTQIGTSQESLKSQTDVLMDISKEAVKNVSNASHDLGRQSTALFKAAQDADQIAEKIRQSEWHTQRDAFMGSAKFIVESLHSLSVDITRVIEKSLPEKTWKAYQKGDVSIFTARLAAMGDQFPAKEVQKKYDDDHDFRSYVNRFIRQFEEVYAQADKNDHGALLVSTFASSDIGKLYDQLCGASGHTSKIQSQKKAA